jgi:hypothetical protein
MERRRSRKNDKYIRQKEGLEKNGFVFHSGAREDRLLTPAKKAFRAAF